MHHASRVRSFYRTIGVLAAACVFVLAPSLAAGAGEDDDPPEEAAPAGEDPTCSVTGYTVSSDDEGADLRGELRGQDLQVAQGVPLDGVDTWTLPRGESPVLVLDSDVAMPAGAISVAAVGATVEIASDEREDAGTRYVTNTYLPLLGSTTRTFGLEVDSGPCKVLLVVATDQSLWSTAVGIGSVIVTGLFAALTVIIARRRRGSWQWRFLLAAPLGLLTGLGLVAMLHEASVLDPFGSIPWWVPLTGVAVAAILPLTRWPRDDSPDEPGEPDPSGNKVPMLVSTAAAVAAVGAVGLTAALVDPEPAQADPVTIAPEYARFVFGQTLADGLSGEYGPASDDEDEAVEYVHERIQGFVDDLASADVSLAEAQPTEVDVGVPPGQHGYPAWFVGSARIPHDDGEASVFARFDRGSADEPWQMTTFAGAPDDVLPGPALDADGWLAAAPDAAELSHGPDDLAELYVEWTENQWDASFDDDGERIDDPDIADDDVLALRPGRDSFLRNYADNFTELPPDLQLLAPDDLGPGDRYSFPTERDVSDEPREQAIVALTDGSALVSFMVDVRQGIYNGDRGDDDEEPTTGECGPNPRIEHGGEQYRLFATDYEIHIQAWVPIESTDEDTVHVSDLIVSHERPSDRSELC